MSRFKLRLSDLVGDNSFTQNTLTSFLRRIPPAIPLLSFSNSHTGWQNGDFNFDGVVNGDDDALIDSAFNTQGASLASVPTAMIAADTAPVASGAPDPAGVVLLVALGFLGRGKRRIQSS